MTGEVVETLAKMMDKKTLYKRCKDSLALLDTSEVSLCNNSNHYFSVSIEINLSRMHRTL